MAVAAAVLVVFLRHLLMPLRVVPQVSVAIVVVRARMALPERTATAVQTLPFWAVLEAVVVWALASAAVVVIPRLHLINDTMVAAVATRYFPPIRRLLSRTTSF